MKRHWLAGLAVAALTLSGCHDDERKAEAPRPQEVTDAAIGQFCGMALVNAHPDYLRESRYWRVYSAFLEELGDAPGCRWSALPREVARWWRRRAEAGSVAALPGATIGRVLRHAGGETEVLP